MVNSHSQKAGFTLIELLVVIAIIAILAAILFPVFAKVREKARQTSCLSNEKQLGLAFVQYTQDYDECYPGTLYYGNGWSSRIYPYVKSIGCYTCPDDPTAAGVGQNAISYGLNDNLVLDGGGGDHDPSGVALKEAGGYALSTLNSPSNTVCLFEIQKDLDTLVANSTPGNPSFGNDSDDAGNLGDYTTSAVTIAAGAYPGGRPATNFSTFTPVLTNGVHTNGANYLACDGHVKWLRPAQVSTGWDAQTSGAVQGFDTFGNDAACATDGMYLDAAKTQPVAMTMSKL